MKILVIGLGSMGKRRIGLIQKYDPKLEIVGVDSDAERCLQVKKQYNIETGCNLKKVLEHKFDCAFISASPLCHADLIHTCLQNNCHVFSELNLVSDGYTNNMELAQKLNKVLFLSSTFLYREEIEHIHKRVLSIGSRHLNYTYHVGQYLPDWHPWESYRDFFVGNKKTNGCREIFAIELPWLIQVFGKVSHFHVFKNKKSRLNIDYADNYLLLMEHESGANGMLEVDVLSRKAVRNLEVFGEDLFLTWDGTPYGLKEFNISNSVEEDVSLYEQVERLDGYSKQIIENAYFKEVQNFFGAIAGRELPKYSFEKDMEILDFIEKIEQ